MSVVRRLFRRLRMPNLGDIREGVQHGQLVLINKKQYLLVDGEDLPDEHAEVKLTFIPHPWPQPWPMSYADMRRLGLAPPQPSHGEEVSR